MAQHDGIRSREQEPLLQQHYESFVNGNGAPKQHPPRDNRKSVKRYLGANIDTRWAELILIFCFAICGMVDSGAYNAYNCFVSMQTGNTVFAALGVSDLPISAPKYQWTKSVTSVVAFLIGAWTFSTLHRFLGERKRWVLAASFVLQTVMTSISARLVLSGSVSGSPVKKPSMTTLSEHGSGNGFPWTDLIPIGLLSFQAAGKVTASRVLQHNALPAVVLTTLFHDLMADPGLFTAGLLHNAGRNRRLGGLVFYFCGATAGGALAKSSLGLSGLLWIAAAAKWVIVFAWLLWGEETEQDQSQTG